MPNNNDKRIQLGAANTLEDFKQIVIELRDTYEPYHNGLLIWNNTTEEDTQNIVLPPWLCQPYIRILPEEHLKKVEEKRKAEVINVRKCGYII